MRQTALICIIVLSALPLAGLLCASLAQGQETAPTTSPATAPADQAWVDAMRDVHSKFTGQKGTLANFGDSITFSMAYWAPLQYKKVHMSPQMQQAFDRVSQYMSKDCWGQKGPEFGNQGGMTILWAKANVDAWLAKLHPETATLMFGTNDLTMVPLKDYEPALREVVKKCLDQGTIVILSTIPPRHGKEAECEKFVAIERQVAKDFKLPLIDFYAEIMQRRPEDWDGSAAKFKKFKAYDVPTLISADGVHPSAPTQYNSDYSPEALNNDGYNLRSYLTLMKYDEVIRQVLQPGATQTGATQPAAQH